MTVLAHHFHSSILREYDVRGIYEETLQDQDAWAIGHCFSQLLGEKENKTVVVCRDGRLSSPILESFLVKGLKEAGVNVICIGVGPTPLLYYAVQSLNACGGIMITGSHNPSDYNGFKMTLKDRPVFGNEIRGFQGLAKKIHLRSHPGSAKEKDVSGLYIQRLLSDYMPKRHLKVIWDAGNGAAGDILTRLVEEMPGEHTVLYGEIDGTFPNHHPDPTDEKNLLDIKRTLKEQKADIGIAFDGDGDRLGVIDDQGNVIWGDQLLMLFSRSLLKEKPGSTIISDVKASDSLFEDIAAHGGVPLMWTTGHSLIKKKMKESGALLAGEMSGHIFFADHYYGFDDALYAAIRLLNIVELFDKPLSEIHTSLPRYFATQEMRIQCSEDRKFKIIEEVKERLKKETSVDVFDLDGVRVKTNEGWWLLRASNTQDMLVCRCEAKKKKDLPKIIKEMVFHLNKSGINYTL